MQREPSHLLVMLAATALACTSRTHITSSTVRLSSGKTVRLIANYLNTSSDSIRTFSADFCATDDATSLEAKVEEADEVMDLLASQATAGAATRAYVKPTDCRRYVGVEWHWPPVVAIWDGGTPVRYELTSHGWSRTSLLWVKP